MSRSILQALAAWLAAGDNRMGEVLIQGEYELRHYLDADVAGLSLHRGGAREIALYDEAGNYRPLRTAPNLRRGWRIECATLDQLRDALDALYPAMLAARLAFEQGRLDTTPLRATLDRQSGMYAVTRKISDAHADAVIGGFCSENGCPGCLKTILWGIAPGLPVTSHSPEKFVPSPGIPLFCAEACNLLVAGIREAVKQGGRS